jgi:hypothetical protein
MFPLSAGEIWDPYLLLFFDILSMTSWLDCMSMAHPAQGDRCKFVICG